MSDDLDEFFARCDDVLDNWDGSPDAMYGKPSRSATEVEAFEQRVGNRVTLYAPPVVVITPAQLRALLVAADEFAQVFGHLMQDFARALSTSATAISELAAALREAEDHEPDPRERALQLRRTRNTGPGDQYRLDGTRRRSAIDSRS